jgi:hypothetical protein
VFKTTGNLTIFNSESDTFGSAQQQSLQEKYQVYYDDDQTHVVARSEAVG